MKTLKQATLVGVVLSSIIVSGLVLLAHQLSMIAEEKGREVDELLAELSENPPLISESKEEMWIVLRSSSAGTLVQGLSSGRVVEVVDRFYPLGTYIRTEYYTGKIIYVSTFFEKLE